MSRLRTRLERLEKRLANPVASIGPSRWHQLAPAGWHQLGQSVAVS